jgi:hypothetical protein
MSIRAGLFHDPYLIGNGRWCSCCFPDGPPEKDDWRPRLHRRLHRGCNECAGAGRITFSAEELIAAAIASRQSKSSDASDRGGWS